MTSGASAAVAAVDVLRRLKNEEKEGGREKAFRNFNFTFFESLIRANLVKLQRGQT